MKKLACLNFVVALLIIAVAPLLLFSGSAQAYVYDHFDSPGINPDLWVDMGPQTGLFSQPGDSYLYFNDSSGGQDDRLRSYKKVTGACSVLMQYSNFQCINNQPSGQGMSSIVGLLLSDGINGRTVTMEEGKNTDGHYFQAQFYHDGTIINLKYFYANINSGWLGIRYNGKLGAEGKVDFMYNFGAGWIVLDSCAPNFSQAPVFLIRGKNQYGQSLSFQVDQIQVITHNPAPINILLLEPDS